MRAGDGEADVVGVDVVDGGAGAGAGARAGVAGAGAGAGGAGGAGGRRRRLRPEHRRPGRIACGAPPRRPPARGPCPTRTCTRARPAGPSGCRTTTWCPATLASHPANTTASVRTRLR